MQRYAHLDDYKSFFINMAFAFTILGGIEIDKKEMDRQQHRQSFGEEKV